MTNNTKHGYDTTLEPPETNHKIKITPTPKSGLTPAKNRITMTEMASTPHKIERENNIRLVDTLLDVANPDIEQTQNQERQVVIKLKVKSIIQGGNLEKNIIKALTNLGGDQISPVVKNDNFIGFSLTKESFTNVKEKIENHKAIEQIQF